jgi:hypothetical protein
MNPIYISSSFVLVLGDRAALLLGLRPHVGIRLSQRLGCGRHVLGQLTEGRQWDGREGGAGAKKGEGVRQKAQCEFVGSRMRVDYQTR